MLYQSRTSNKSQPPGRRLNHADSYPKCWVDFPHGVSACSERGQDIPSFWREKDFAGKPIVSLNHPEPKTSIRAASILGNLREKHAQASRLATLFSIRGYHPRGA
jgi:hypothetical protein